MHACPAKLDTKLGLDPCCLSLETNFVNAHLQYCQKARTWNTHICGSVEEVVTVPEQETDFPVMTAPGSIPS